MQLHWNYRLPLAQAMPWEEAPPPPPATQTHRSITFSDFKQSLRDYNTGKINDSEFRNGVLSLLAVAALVVLVIHLRQRHRHAGSEPDEQRREDPGHLLLRHINLRRRSLGHIVLADVTNDADDFSILIRNPRQQQYPPSDWILSREIPPGKRLVHHGHRRAVGPVPVAEQPAPHQRNLQQREEPLAHRIIDSGCRVAVSSFPPKKPNRKRQRDARQRRARIDSHLIDAGHRLQRINQTVVVSGEISVGLIA